MAKMPNMKRHKDKLTVKTNEKELIRIVIAPSLHIGEWIVKRLGIPKSTAAIITQPEHLRGIMFHPYEDVWVAKGTSGEFFDTISTCCENFRKGQQVNIRMVKV